MSNRVLFGEIEVLWARSTGVCRGRFLDAFEPLERVTFTDAGDGPAQDLVPVPGDIDPVSSANFDAPATWPLEYMKLRPLPHVLERVARLKEEMGGPYIAIHVRHSDHDENAARFGHVTHNDELLRFCTRAGARPVYLATECKATIAWFRERLARVKINVPWDHQVINYDDRPGTLSDAVVDMWMCLGADAFRGTWMSSFSETVALMRCGGAPLGGYVPHVHMPSTDAEHYRGRADLAEAWIAAREGVA